MDFAYDHIQESAYFKQAEDAGDGSRTDQPQASLSEDVQEAYKAIASSPWGAKIGGFLGSVVKQGESVYNQASKELAEVSEDATKGFSDLRNTIISRTRSLSLATVIPEGAKAEAPIEGEENQTTPTRSKGSASSSAEPQGSSATVLSRLRSEAAKRLKDLQKAEDAADEALLQFGSNVRNFLRDAITIAPPSESAQDSAVLFESKDAEGKRVIHASRFDAQLHVIHTSTEGFTKDPEGEEYDLFAKEFDVEQKTDDIATDLNKYSELRLTMEKLVPDQIPYADFWKRYYFLRLSIETAESRRRDLLIAASNQDEVGWSDDDSDSDEEQAGKTAGKKRVSVESSTTISPPPVGLLRVENPRKSNDRISQADSEASYDVVGAASGTTTRATSSPKAEKQRELPIGEGKNHKDGSGEDDSDEDWE